MRPPFVEIGLLDSIPWLILLTVLHVAAVSADEAAPRREVGPWAEGLVIAPGMDASGRILRQSVFVGLDLRNAKFDGAHLGGAEIYQCDLRNASFVGAVLTGLSWGDCNVDGADFSGAVLNGAKPIHGGSGFELWLTYEQFASTRNYRTKDLSECVVHLRPENDTLFSRDLDLRDADLRNATIGYCDLRNSDLTNAKITGATFYQCRLAAKQIASTHDYATSRALRSISFGQVDGPIDFSGYDLTGSGPIPSNANIADATIAGCRLGWPLSAKQLRSTRSFRTGTMTRIHFTGQDFSGFDFSAQNLSGCHFTDCSFARAGFDDAIITDSAFTAFRRSELELTAEQLKSTWNYKHNRMSGIRLPTALRDELYSSMLPYPMKKTVSEMSGSLSDAEEGAGGQRKIGSGIRCNSVKMKAE
jgi:uncharacterized protein YjbI with pentapeptide repeats